MLLCSAFSVTSAAADRNVSDTEAVLYGIALDMAGQTAGFAEDGRLELFTSEQDVLEQAQSLAAGLDEDRLVSARLVSYDIQPEGRLAELFQERSFSAFAMDAWLNTFAAKDTASLAASSILHREDVYRLAEGFEGNALLLLSFRDQLCLSVNFVSGENGTMHVSSQCFTGNPDFGDLSQMLAFFEVFSETDASGAGASVNLLEEKELSCDPVSSDEALWAQADPADTDEDALIDKALSLAAQIGAIASSEELSSLYGLPEPVLSGTEPFCALTGKPDLILFIPEEAVIEALIPASSDTGEQLSADSLNSLFTDEALRQRILTSWPAMLTARYGNTELLAVSSILNASDSWQTADTVGCMCWLVWKETQEPVICSVAFRTNSHGVLNATAGVIPGAKPILEAIDAAEYGSSCEELAGILSQGTFITP